MSATVTDLNNRLRISFPDFSGFAVDATGIQLVGRFYGENVTLDFMDFYVASTLSRYPEKILEDVLRVATYKLQYIIDKERKWQATQER